MRKTEWRRVSVELRKIVKNSPPIFKFCVSCRLNESNKNTEHKDTCKRTPRQR